MTQSLPDPEWDHTRRIWFRNIITSIRFAQFHILSINEVEESSEPGYTGSQATYQAVTRYLVRRSRDIRRSSDPASSFLASLSVLAVNLSEPGRSFPQPALPIGAFVIARILERRGWKTAFTDAEWVDEVVAKIPFGTAIVRKRAAAQLQRVIRRDWEETYLLGETAYDDVIEWAARDPYPWYEDLCRVLDLPV